MSKSIHQKMHEEHVRWQNDLEAWQADIDQWKKALKKSVDDVATINDALSDALTALENYADSVWEHAQRLKAHEGIVSQEARAGENATDKEWAHSHEAESSQHARLTDVHQRIKHHQHAVVAEVQRLLDKLLEAF